MHVHKRNVRTAGGAAYGLQRMNSTYACLPAETGRT
jgi:hypothetical protein